MASNVAENEAGSGDKTKGQIDRITSKFTWDKKIVLWEIHNFAEACGRRNTIADEPEESTTVSNALQEYHSMLDIDYINSTHFNAGTRPENTSLWSLSLYKQPNREYLGLFLHLLEIESESVVNRRFHHNHSFDDFESHPMYIRYTMSIISPTGTVLHKIENPNIISMSGGNSWGEDHFIRLDLLTDPNSHFLTDDTLRVQVDFYLFQQLAHSINEAGPLSWETSQIDSTIPENGNTVMESLWTKREFTDVDIQCGDRLFPVHKCVLSAASLVFEAMFASNMTEASDSKVIIHDTEPKALNAMLEFIYTGKVSEGWNWDDFDGVSHLLNTCEKYQIKALKEFCLKMACDRIQVSNAGEVAVLLHMYNADEIIKNFVYGFITRNIKVLRDRQGFTHLVNAHPAAFTPILLSKALTDLL